MTRTATGLSWDSVLVAVFVRNRTSARRSAGTPTRSVDGGRNVKRRWTLFPGVLSAVADGQRALELFAHRPGSTERATVGERWISHRPNPPRHPSHVAVDGDAADAGLRRVARRGRWMGGGRWNPAADPRVDGNPWPAVVTRVETSSEPRRSAGLGCHVVVNFSPTTPATTAKRQVILATLADSPNNTIPSVAVPAAPIPVQTA